MIDESVFSDEYTSGDQTSTDKKPGEEEPVGEQIQSAVTRYGTGKPKRITIRAQITHD